jgi:hypothetical protein
MKNIGRIAFWVISFSCLLLIGCGGGDRSSVSGTVTLDGEPVTKGSILFDPVESREVKPVGLIENGSYSLTSETGPKPGKHKVEIRWAKPTGKQVPVKDDPPNMIDETKEAVPAKYNTSTELTVEITPGSNRHDFPLTSK